METFQIPCSGPHLMYTTHFPSGDGSGYNIEDQIKEKIEEYAVTYFKEEIRIDWRRWAFLPDDFKNHGIVSLDSKEEDNNLPMFYEHFGEDAEFAEVDSLPTQELIDGPEKAEEGHVQTYVRTLW
jgi:hypothetical protein